MTAGRSVLVVSLPRFSGRTEAFLASRGLRVDRIEDPTKALNVARGYDVIVVTDALVSRWQTRGRYLFPNAYTDQLRRLVGRRTKIVIQGTPDKKGGTAVFRKLIGRDAYGCENGYFEGDFDQHAWRDMVRAFCW